jgi:hypothetical protein
MIELSQFRLKCLEGSIYRSLYLFDVNCCNSHGGLKAFLNSCYVCLTNANC